MKKRILQPLLVLLLPVLLVLVIVQPCPAVGKTNISQNPRVLFLSSYSYEWESIPKQLAGIKDTLNGYARVDYIFMDTKRLSYDDVKKDVYEHVSAHMKDDKYDYVIAGDDAALRFVLEHRKDLFASLPVVFEGINNVSFAYKAAEDPLITGIVETFPLKETIALASEINPKATRVVGISDSTESGLGSTAQLMHCQESFPKLTFSTIDCSAMTHEDIGRTLAKFDDNVILIYLMMTTDADGNKYSNTEAVEYITASAGIPVYKADELGVGVGLLGGVVVSFHAMASDASDIVLALERGADISDYPVRTAKTYCVFDKKIMEQFGITKKEFPLHIMGKFITLMINRPILKLTKAF